MGFYPFNPIPCHGSWSKMMLNEIYVKLRNIWLPYLLNFYTINKEEFII